MQTIIVKVLKPIREVHKEVYRNSFEWSTDIVVPFDSLYKSLMLLYPGCIVEFSIFPSYNK